MSDYNIPDEELNFGSFDIADITKTVQQVAKENPNNPAQDEKEEEYGIDVNQPITLTPDDIRSVTGGEKEEEESIETNNEEKEEEVVDNTSNTYGNDVYAAAIELAKENGLLNIPDNVGEITDEVWQDIIKQNEYDRELRALNNVRMNAGDPKIVELLDYVMKGGTWYGAEEMKETIQEEIDISTLDVATEEDQRYLIEMYLSDGLDQNNPAHLRRLQNIDQEINNVFDRLEQDELAQEAKQFLLVRTNQQKENIARQQQAHVEQQRQQEQQQQQARQNWNNQFKESLNDRIWSQNKKDQVVSQFDIVQLDNGSEMEMWQYKFDAIWRNPKATQIFMDFLSDFDENTLQFKQSGQSVNKQVTSTIKNLINQKSQTKSNTRYTSNRRTNTDSLPTIDPHNY